MELARRTFLQLAAGAAVVPAITPIARAQVYPSRSVRMIIPFAPGGPTDVFARLIAQKFSAEFGKQFYVENIVGGAGNIGTAQAARAAPDGYTILVSVSAFVTNPAFLSKSPYDPIKDFAPVALPVASAIALVVHPSVPANTLAELVALIRANPGKYSYAIRMSLGLDVVHVPFTGAGPAVAAVVAGQVPIGISSLPPAMPQINEGSLRALALTSKSRSRKLPDIPTASEAGYPILEGDQWLGVFLPASTPEEIIATLHRRIVEFVAQPDMKERLESLDFYPVESTPREFAERIKVEFETWRQVIQAAHIKAQ